MLCTYIHSFWCDVECLLEFLLPWDPSVSVHCVMVWLEPFLYPWTQTSSCFFFPYYVRLFIEVFIYLFIVVSELRYGVIAADPRMFPPWGLQIDECQAIRVSTVTGGSVKMSSGGSRPCDRAWCKTNVPVTSNQSIKHSAKQNEGKKRNGRETSFVVHWLEPEPTWVYWLYCRPVCAHPLATARTSI